MTWGEPNRPRQLTATVSPRMANEAGATASSWSMCSVRGLRQATVLEPVGESLRPVPDGDVVGSLPHVEGMLALRVDVGLDRGVRRVVLAREIEHHVGDVFVVRGADQEQRRRIRR